MLQDELNRRRRRLMDRRYKRSGLEEKLALADFDWRFNPKLPRAACCQMLEFEGRSYRLKEAATRIAISPETS